MTTIKSYTNIEQSKKLAEILPVESADLCWVTDEIEPLWGVVKSEPDDDFDVIPCWSLAALLDVMPLEVETHKQTDGHKMCYYVESYMKRTGKEIHLSTERYEILVDACVEMIIKIHGQKLL